MSTKIKICGVTRPEDASAAGELGAWAVGFIFAPSSPRRLSMAQAERAAKAVPAGVLKVGVFMDQPEDDIRAAQSALGLDLLQLHGAESDLTCRLLGRDKVIKAVALSDHTDVAAAAAREAGILLVDRPRGVAGAPATAWEFAAALAQRRERTLLAGALDAANVDAAVRRVRPWGVDVCSGVESAPGIKDRTKLEDFFAAVRRGDGP